MRKGDLVLAIIFLSAVALGMLGGYIMGHGYPPWSGVKKETVFSLPIDMAELAARLGSIVTFDRRGDVLWLTDFDHGLAEIYTVASGIGSDHCLSTITTYRGAYSLKLIPGSADGDYAAATKLLPYPVLSKFGLEASFTWHADVDYLYLRIIIFSGTQRSWWEIRLHETDGKIYYYDEDGNIQEIDDLPNWLTSTYIFHTAKLVVDAETGNYVRLIVDDTGYPLGDYSGEVVDDATPPDMRCTISVYTTVGNNPPIYVDGVIITQNEPGVRG